MDRTVDHLFVFEGNGVIKDFPGNYSDYREWKNQQKEAKAAKKEERPKEHVTKRDYSSKMTFKERKEFEALSADIENLEAEKRSIEESLNGGTLGMEELTQKSKRISEIMAELEDKEMRWLELSEKE